MSANAAEKPTKKERTMKKTKRNKGFTLVELVIVIAVIAILAAVLIPTFVTVVDNANKSAALQEGTNLKTEILTLYEGDFKQYCTDFVKETDGYGTAGAEATSKIVKKGFSKYTENVPDDVPTFADIINVDGTTKSITGVASGSDYYITFKSNKGYFVKITADKVETSKDAFSPSSTG